MSANLTFEALRDALETLDVPSGEARSLRWVVEDRLGAAKTASGDYEIFLLGEPVVARSGVVRRHLEYGAWQPTHGGQPFTASRIVLPPAAHFAPIAALIAMEFARGGLSEGVPTQAVFDDVEPIIELAIRRGSLSDEVILGLFGELLTLLTAMRARPLSLTQKAVLVGAWRGWQRGRDFVLGRNAIEVKTTRGAVSIHAFSGLHQLEEQALEDGDLETLHVLSLGLQEVSEGGQSLPGLVDDLLCEVGDPVEGDGKPSPLQAQLLSWIEAYGGGGRGYRHQSMRDWQQYGARFSLSFAPRLYRIRDEAMLLLPRATVEETFLRPDSLSFEVAFPARVSAYNPSLQWQSDLGAMVAALAPSPAED